MHINQFEKIKKINNNSKIIIGIGDSFCSGAGAESIETWERNNWDIGQVRSDGIGYMEAYENSFINLLTKKYFNDYTSINFGMAGRGNRYAINELFLYPYTNLHKAKEKIVIFVSSSLERYDFMKNIFSTNDHTTTIWPHGFVNGKLGYADLVGPNNQSIFNEHFKLSEFVLMFQHLLTWCKLYDAKLLFVSAFSHELNLEYMMDNLLVSEGYDQELKIISSLLSTIPWRRQVKPMGYNTISEMLLFLEGREDLLKKEYGLIEYNVEKHTDENYMSKCQHPAKKGQELLCDIFYEHIKNYDVINDYDYEKHIRDFYYEKFPKLKNTNTKLI